MEGCREMEDESGSGAGEHVVKRVGRGSRERVWREQGKRAEEEQDAKK